MIVGIPKRNLLALPRALKRVEKGEPVAERAPRIGLVAAFATMMERQAALVIRGLGE